MGIEDEWLAFQLDLAALLTGREVEEVISDPKRKRTVDQALAAIRLRNGKHGDTEMLRRRDTGSGRVGGYKRIGKPGMQKMRVPESGVW